MYSFISFGIEHVVPFELKIKCLVLGSCKKHKGKEKKIHWIYILSSSLVITAFPYECETWIQLATLFEEIWSHTDTCNATCNSMLKMKNGEVEEGNGFMSYK